MIPIYHPYKIEAAQKYVMDALASTWVGPQGEFKDAVAATLSRLTGYKYVLMTNNGTSAWHLVIKSILNKYHNINRVIVPSACYVAVWNALLFDNTTHVPAFTIEPIDLSIKTLQAEYDRVIGADENTLFCIVHNAGGKVDISALKQQFPKSIFVTDSAEYTYFHPFDQVEAMSLSFFGNKTVTCGEGGAFCTNDKSLYDFANQTHGQGQGPERYIHPILGYNYRMTNIAAAILLSQLDLLDEIYYKKLGPEGVWNRYADAFLDIRPKVEIIPFRSEGDWIYTIRVPGSNYEKAKLFFDAAGIETRPVFYPMSRHNHLKYWSNPKEEVNATILNQECLMLPSYPGITREDQDYVIQKVREYVG